MVELFSILAIIAFLIFPYLFFKYGLKAFYIFAVFIFLNITLSFLYSNKIYLILILGVIPSVIFGFVYSQSRSVHVYIILSSLIMFVVYACVYHYIYDYKNSSMYTQAVSYVTDKLNQNDTLLNDQPGAKEEYLKSIKSTFQENEEMIRALRKSDVSHFMIYINSVFHILVTSILLRIIYFTKILKLKIKPEGMTKFKLNDYFVILLVVLLAGTIFLANTELLNNEIFVAVYKISLNGLLILASFYFLQAISVFRFFILKHKLPGVILPLVLILIALSGQFVLYFSAALISAFGLLDMWADFRKLNPDSKEESENN